MSTFASDLRLGLRGLLRRPAFAALVALTLALGAGADATIFAVARGMLFAPFPYRDPGSVVTVWSRWEGYPKTWVSFDEARLYRREVADLAGFALYSPQAFNLTAGESPERVGGAGASHDLLATLGAEPILGRSFTPEEDVADAHVVVIGHGLWQRRFGGRADVVGRVLEVDGLPYEVVGVLPPGLRLPEDYRSGVATELLTPLGADLDAPSTEAKNGGGHNCFGVGRLVPGATAVSVSAALEAIADRRTESGIYPRDWAFKASALGLREDLLGTVEPVLLLLGGAVALVLLLAAANVVHLLVVRHQERRDELAVRAALGASSEALARLLAVEAGLVGLVGGGMAIGVTGLALALLRRLAPPTLPRLDAVALDATAAAVALGLALGVALAVGLVAAQPASRDVALRSARGEIGRGSRRRRSLLVTFETATALVLLIGAALMVRSLQHLVAIDPGFRPEGALTFRVQLSPGLYPEPADVVAFVERAAERLRAIPGVEMGGATRLLPLATRVGDFGAVVEGYEPKAGERVAADCEVVTPGALEAMGARLVAGRLPEAQDRRDGALVVVVNETFARRYFGDASPLGRRLRLAADGKPWATVIGMVEDVRHNDLLQPARPAFFWPHAQFDLSSGFAPRGMSFVLRTSADPMTLWPAAREVLRRLDPRLPPTEARSLADVAAVATAPSRFAAQLLLALAVLALVLAAVGVYGVLARSVALRTREIGVRAALGAGRRDLVAALVAEAMVAVAIGLVGGLGLAAMLVRCLAGMVHGVSLHDPATFAGVALFLAAVAAVASAVPAWQATRLDAVQALKAD